MVTHRTTRGGGARKEYRNPSIIVASKGGGKTKTHRPHFVQKPGLIRWNRPNTKQKKRLRAKGAGCVVGSWKGESYPEIRT